MVAPSLVEPRSRETAPWPCDFGARVQSTYNGMLRRTVRAGWRRCLGNCGGKWFWSTDALTHRMCHTCSPSVSDGGGEGAAAPQTTERAAEAMVAPPHSPKSPKQPATPRAVICAGRRFASAEAAADALDLTAKIVRWRCTHGWRGWHFADQPVPAQRKSALARPVIAEGERYSSVADAARALGMSQPAIGDRIKRGCDGYRYADD